MVIVLSSLGHGPPYRIHHAMNASFLSTDSATSDCLPTPPSNRWPLARALSGTSVRSSPPKTVTKTRKTRQKLSTSPQTTITTPSYTRTYIIRAVLVRFIRCCLYSSFNKVIHDHNLCNYSMQMWELEHGAIGLLERQCGAMSGNCGSMLTVVSRAVSVRKPSVII